MTWQQALDYAQGPGVAVIVGFIIFMAMEYIPGLTELIANRKWKRLFVLGLSMIIPIGALVLEALTVPGGDTLSWNSAFAALVAGGTSFGVSQAVQTTTMSTGK